MSLQRLENVTWWLFGFLAMHFVLQSLVRLIIAISLLEKQNYIYSGIELVNLTLAGWVFFTFFAPVSTVGIIKKPNIQEDPQLLNRTILVLSFVGTIRLAFFSLPYAIEGVSHLPVLGLPTRPSFAMFCMLGLILGLLTYRYLHIGFKRKSQSFEDIIDLRAKASPLIKKLQKHLTEEQLRELARLLYESQRLQEVSIRDIGRFLLLTIFLSLIIDILIELMSRVLL